MPLSAAAAHDNARRIPVAFLQEHGLVQPFHSEDTMSETEAGEDFAIIVEDLQRRQAEAEIRAGANLDRATKAETRAVQAEAAIAERYPFDGPAYAGLAQFRCSDGRVCLTLAADGRMALGDGFPNEDAASAAFVEALARNVKGHLNNQHVRTVSAEAETAALRAQISSMTDELATLRTQVSEANAERLALRHANAVAEAKVQALSAAR